MAGRYLIEGVSGSGKTTLAEELERRGHRVLHGDRELAYQGDPETGEPLDGPPPGVPADAAWRHGHHLWDEGKVRLLAADRRRASFFCGGSRNAARFLDLFDEVFVLEVDRATLARRLAARPEDEFGGRPDERRLILRFHATKEGLPRRGVAIDATRPVAAVADDLLSRCGAARREDPARAPP